MNTFLSSKIAYAGLAFLLTLVSGTVLSNLGRPYNSLIFTIHKLIAVGTIVLIGMKIHRLSQAVDVRILYVIFFAITGLLFLALLISGALLSINESAQPAILRIHQAAPLLALFSAAASIYLLASSTTLSQTGVIK